MNKYLFNPDKHDTRGMVSASQILTYLKCSQAWKYRYVDKLIPKIDRPVMTIGKLCHKGLEAVWRIRYQQQEEDDTFEYDIESFVDPAMEAMEQLFSEYISNNMFLEEEIPYQEETLETAKRVFMHTIYDINPLQYNVMGILNAGNIPAVELHFVMPCAGSKGMHGFIDVILQDKKTGNILCTDFKFRKTLASDDTEQFNLQNTIYIKAAAKLGIACTGTMTYQHLNTPPSIPSLTTKGTVSRAKIKTDWNTYAQFCRDNDLDPADYADEMIPKLAEIEWSKKTIEYRNNDTIKNIWNRVIVPSAYSISAKRSKIIPCMFPMNCTIMCDYAGLCQADLRGYDLEYIKQSLFISDKNIVDSQPPDVVK